MPAPDELLEESKGPVKKIPFDSQGNKAEVEEVKNKNPIIQMLMGDNTDKNAMGFVKDKFLKAKK